jgi:hypothetical protein
MKNYCYNYIKLNLGILVLVTLILHSCGQKDVPQELIGYWKTDEIQITVRTQHESGEFEFTKDTAIIKLIINSDYIVDGFIGSAKFKNGEIKTNWFLPTKITGCAFTIECGSIGRIFENDPLDNKEVQLWLGPLEGNIKGELRYTQGGAHFPMAVFILNKVAD